MSMKTVLLAFCLIWTTKAQQECRTITAQRPCVFPFTYKGISYDGCTYAGNSPTAWCALDNSGTKWDDCQDNCPIASSNGNVNSGVKAWGNWGQCSGGCGAGNGVEERRRGEEVETRSCTTLDRCIGNNNGGNNINNGNNGNNANTNKDCYTTGGPQPNQLCVFPFKHGALEYHDCTRAGHKQKKLWCSTKVDSTGRHIDGQGLFGTCSGFCFTNANNGGGGGAGAPQGVWNNWSNWGQCSGGNGGGNGGDNGVSERRRACQGANCQGNKIETRSCSNSVGSGASGRCITNGGPAAGQACVFPFKYARRTHSGCGVWRWGGPNQGKKWCSTKTSRNGNHISKSGNYGLCPNTPQCNGGGNGNGGGNVNFGNGGGNGNSGNGNGGGNVNFGNGGGNGNSGNGNNGGNGGSVDTSDRGTVVPNSDPQIDVSDRSANQEANVGAPL